MHNIGVLCGKWKERDQQEYDDVCTRNFRVKWNAGKFFNTWGTGGFSRKTRLQRVSQHIAVSG